MVTLFPEIVGDDKDQSLIGVNYDRSHSISHDLAYCRRLCTKPMTALLFGSLILSFPNTLYLENHNRELALNV